MGDGGDRMLLLQSVKKWIVAFKHLVSIRSSCMKYDAECT